MMSDSGLSEAACRRVGGPPGRLDAVRGPADTADPKPRSFEKTMSPERTSERPRAHALRTRGRRPDGVSHLTHICWLAAISVLSLGTGCGDSEAECESVIEARPYDVLEQCLRSLRPLVCSDQLPLSFEGRYLCVERDGKPYVGPDTLRIDPTLGSCDSETARAAVDAPLCVLPDT
ncbi:MAG: hypothetical protein ACJAYU_001053 [Bradymonadia bacterium]|jgi:hypothetical protein